MLKLSLRCVGELVQVEADTDKLISELEASIAEADRFIKETSL